MTAPGAAPRERLAFRSRDGVLLSATIDRPAHATEGAVLILPGFWRRAESERIRWLAGQLARRWLVATLDFRGHGLSEGTYTFGRLEDLDVQAALEALPALGVRRVAIVGMSMGGHAALAGLARGDAGAGRASVVPCGAALIAAPGDFGRIRPRPWRGARDVAWADTAAVPRFEWSFPFTRKRVPERMLDAVPRIPLRLLHARHDWLVDHELGVRLHEADPSRSELLLLETPGLHADELLGRHADMVLRLLRPFLDACLQGVPEDAPLGGVPAADDVDAAPWRDALARSLSDPATHSRDLGGIRPAGVPRDVQAVGAGRDGVHLVLRAGDETCVARGLRDGSVHGLNLLGTALAADGPTWPASVRSALAAAHAKRLGLDAPPRRQRVVLRGSGGFAVEPDNA